MRLVLRETAYDNGHGHPRTWKLPGDAGYVAHTSGQLPALPVSAPWALRFRAEGAADGDLNEGVGALVSSVVPAALRFTADKVIAMTYDIDVPKGGAAELVHVLASEPTQAALDADVAAAIARLSPPADAGPGDPPPGGDPGTSSPPPSGGGSGTTGGSPPGGGEPPAGGSTAMLAGPGKPVLVRRGRAALRGRTLRLGLASRCPGTGPACRFQLRLVRPGRRSAVVLGPVTVTVRANRTVLLKLAVPARRRAALGQGRLVLRAVLRRAGVPAIRVDRRFALRRRR